MWGYQRNHENDVQLDQFMDRFRDGCTRKELVFELSKVLARMQAKAAQKFVASIWNARATTPTVHNGKWIATWWEQEACGLEETDYQFSLNTYGVTTTPSKRESVMPKSMPKPLVSNTPPRSYPLPSLSWVYNPRRGKGTESMLRV